MHARRIAVSTIQTTVEAAVIRSGDNSPTARAPHLGCASFSRNATSDWLVEGNCAYSPTDAKILFDTTVGRGSLGIERKLKGSGK